jgi:hypothetical protein
MQHSLRPTANSKDKYVPKEKPRVHVAVNVGNIDQRGAAYVTLCVRKRVVAELLQYQKCPVP